MLFWLSLIPVTTAWLGENPLSPVPTATYGAALLMAAIAYYLLQQAIVHKQGKQSVLAHALGRDLKGKLSIVHLSDGGWAGIRGAVGVDRDLRRASRPYGWCRTAASRRCCRKRERALEFRVM